MVEMLDVVDSETGKPIGETVSKEEAHKDGVWHLASHIWVYNSENKILLQKRAKNKKLLPDLWDVSAAGHVSAGEDVKETALRELEEELGLKASPSEMKFEFVHKKGFVTKEGLINNEFYHVFTFESDAKIENLILQKEEVQDAKYFSLEELESILESKRAEEFVIPMHGYKEKIFEILKMRFNM